MFRSLSEEEIGCVQRWQAPRIDVDTRIEDGTRVPLHQVTASVPGLANGAEFRSVSDGVDDSSQPSALLLQQTYDEGYSRGLADADHRAAVSLEQDVRPLLQALQARLSLEELAVCDEMIELARAMAEMILQRELRQSADVMEQLLQQALKASGFRNSGLQIRVNPEDHTMLVNTACTDPSIQWIADASLARGALIVDSGASRLRAGIAEQLGRIIVDMDALVAESAAEPEQATVDAFSDMHAATVTATAAATPADRPAKTHDETPDDRASSHE